MEAFIAVLPGDGIGPEVTASALRVMQAAAGQVGAELRTETALIGGAAYDAVGHPLPPETLALCRRADAVLFGAIGGPRWDTVQPVTMRPETGGLLPLRKGLGLYANLRPARLFPALASASSLRPDLVAGGLDILVVRELTGGIYFGLPRGRSEDGLSATDTCTYSVEEIERIAGTAFRSAMSRGRRVCSVDKANVLETSRLWREVVTRLGREWPEVELTHMLVDNCAMQLVRDPGQFDVIVSENLFGDILSDEAAMLTGSLGMLPSASMGEGTFGLYEPVHGSAPDIAGKGIANPLAAILSSAMLLRHSLGLAAAADAIDAAVEAVLASGARTGDIARAGEPTVGTEAMTELVLKAMGAGACA